MIRRAFTMRLKPESLAEYKRHHDNIWPELVAEIERAGIASITTFEHDLDLFLVSEISDEAAWDRLWNSEVHKRWAEVMEPLMHLREDGIVEAGELAEVFHLTTADDNGEPSAPASEPADDLIAAILAEAAGESAAEPFPSEPVAEPSAAPAKAARKTAKPRRKKAAAKKMAAKKAAPKTKGKRKTPKRPATKKPAGKKRAAKKATPKKSAKRGTKKKTKKR